MSVSALLRPGAGGYWSHLTAAATAGWHWPAATIAGITDGDTLDAQVTKTLDVGFGGTTTTTFRVRLRLARINASPLHTPTGADAAAWLRGLLPIGTAVDLTTLDAYAYGGPGYSPGEWMCELVLPDGRNVSDLSVSLGHSVYWDGHGARPGG